MLFIDCCFLHQYCPTLAHQKTVRLLFDQSLKHCPDIMHVLIKYIFAGTVSWGARTHFHDAFVHASTSFHKPNKTYKRMTSRRSKQTRVSKITRNIIIHVHRKFMDAKVRNKEDESLYMSNHDPGKREHSSSS